MKVRDVIKKDVQLCHPDMNLAEVGHLMLEADCGVIPVVDQGGKPIGVITDRDAFIALATRNRPAAELKVGDIVAGNHVLTCTTDDDIQDVLETMRTHQIRRVPIKDEEGRLAGIVSINDLVIVAKSDREAKTGDVTFKDIALTFKAICTHPTPVGRK
ncbi:MAG: CBS domain-containing protein [Planctomycetes bacterium]|nr:CBS domain-containing protein [Planctomycetota bacterium]